MFIFVLEEDYLTHKKVMQDLFTENQRLRKELESKSKATSSKPSESEMVTSMVSEENIQEFEHKIF